MGLFGKLKEAKKKYDRYQDAQQEKELKMLKKKTKLYKARGQAAKAKNQYQKYNRKPSGKPLFSNKTKISSGLGTPKDPDWSIGDKEKKEWRIGP